MKNSKLSKVSGKKNGASHATSMAELMSSVKPSLVTFKKGDVVKGLITKLTPQEILVDINGKTEAVVLEKDRRILRNLLSTLKVGDTVDVSILNVESDMGYPVVSLRRFLDNLSWKQLEQAQKNHEHIEVVVNEVTRGGLLVSSDGVSGFLPNSHTVLISENGAVLQSPSDFLGKTLKVYVIELNRKMRKIIFSQKTIMEASQFAKIQAMFKKDQTVEATVTNVTPFGVFVSVALPQKIDGISSVDGLIHISEVSWEQEASNMQELFEVGKKVEAILISTDADAKRLDLSLKRLTQDPFEEIAKHLSIDQKVTGTVLKVTSTGVSVELDIISGVSSDMQPLEALIRKDKIPPTIQYEVGSSVAATITQVDKAKHRIYLTPVLKEKPIGYR